MTYPLGTWPCCGAPQPPGDGFAMHLCCGAGVYRAPKRADVLAAIARARAEAPAEPEPAPQTPEPAPTSQLGLFL